MQLIQSLLVFLIAVNLWDVWIVSAATCTCGKLVSKDKGYCNRSKTCYNGGICKHKIEHIGMSFSYLGSPYCDCPTTSTCDFSGPNCQNEQKKKCCAIKTENGVGEPTSCQFPFKYGGYTFNECTFYKASNAGRNQGWCSTKVDSEGKHVSGHWGNCAVGCPKELEMCSGGYSEPGNKSLSPKGKKCKSKGRKSPCEYDGGKWGSTYCWTSNDKKSWGAECVPCR